MPRFVISQSTTGVFTDDPPCEGCEYVKVRKGHSYWTKAFDSLDEVLAFMAEQDEDIIIYQCSIANGEMMEIRIYDGYNE